MNKNKLITTALIAWMVVAQASAQSFIKKITDNLYGGPQIEANASHFIASDFDGSSTMRLGGAVGGFIGLKVSKHFDIREDILVYYRTSQLQMDNNVRGDLKNVGAELAFYAMGHLPLGSGQLMLGVGPYASYGFSAKLNTDDGTDIDMYTKDADDKAPLKRLNAGIAVTAGYELKCGLQFKAAYKLGILDALDAQSAQSTLLPSTVSLGLAWRIWR